MKRLFQLSSVFVLALSVITVISEPETGTVADTPVTSVLTDEPDRQEADSSPEFVEQVQHEYSPEPIAQPSTVTEGELDETIPQRRLVVFSASWCAACKQLEPTLQRLRGSGINVRVIDFDQNRDLSRQHNVTSLPTILVAEGDQVVNRLVGVQSESKLMRLLKPVVKQSLTTESSAPQTATCQCQGFREHLCFCLKSGIACKCSASIGSVWNMDAQGNPLDKTGQYAKPEDPPQVQSSSRSRYFTPATTFQQIRMSAKQRRVNRIQERRQRPGRQ